MTIRPLFLLVAAAVSGPVAGAEVPPPLTLAAALRLAQENNLDLMIVREEVAVASAGEMEARSAAYPHLNFEAGYTRLDDVPAFEIGGGVIQMGQKNNYETLVEAEQVLFAGGGVLAGIRQSGRLTEAAEEQAEYASSETAYAVHRLFNLVLLGREEVKVVRGALDLSRQNRDEVQARFEQGLATNFDRLRAQEQVSRAEADLLRVENGLRVRRLDLLRALDLPLDDPRPVVGDLEFVAAPDLPSDPIGLALETRRDLKRARRLYEAQEEALNRARSGWWPSLGVFGEYRYADPTREYEDDWEDSWLVGLRLKFSIFDGLSTEGKCRGERARLRRAELAVSNLETAVRREVTAALFDVETATEVVGARRRNMAEAEEALRLARKGYEEGIQQQLDVLDAQQSLTRSRSSYAAAVYEQVMARVRLARSTGTLTGEEGVAAGPYN